MPLGVSKKKLAEIDAWRHILFLAEWLHISLVFLLVGSDETTKRVLRWFACGPV
jgi:hypothetical protein